MKTSFVIAAVVAFFAAPALAQEAPAPSDGKTDMFAIIDADSSGAITLEEVQSVDGNVTEKDFAKYDTDADKKLTKMEFANWDADIQKSKAKTAG